jgi:hypothetical protein
VLKSFPLDIENAKNSSVISAHTVWLPRSSAPVSQQPERVKPVIGSKLQVCNVVPSTFFCCGFVIIRFIELDWI